MAPADKVLQRVLDRLQDLPQLALPTDYPRPAGDHSLSLVEAREQRRLDSRTGAALLRLSLYDDHDGDTDSDSDNDSDDGTHRGSAAGIQARLAAAAAKSTAARSGPSAFHILLAAFTLLLHRYTGDTDLVIATSSPSSPEPLLLRIKLEPTDSFWSLVKRVQFLEQEAEDDKVPYDHLVEALPGHGKEAQREGGPAPPPVFRVRFIDQTEAPDSAFLEQTSLTTDLTVFVSTTPSAGRRRRLGRSDARPRERRDDAVVAAHVVPVHAAAHLPHPVVQLARLFATARRPRPRPARAPRPPRGGAPAGPGRQHLAPHDQAAQAPARPARRPRVDRLPRRHHRHLQPQRPRLPRPHVHRREPRARARRRSGRRAHVHVPPDRRGVEPPRAAPRRGRRRARGGRHGLLDPRRRPRRRRHGHPQGRRDLLRHRCVLLPSPQMHDDEL